MLLWFFFNGESWRRVSNIFNCRRERLCFVKRSIALSCLLLIISDQWTDGPTDQLMYLQTDWQCVKTQCQVHATKKQSTLLLLYKNMSSRSKPREGIEIATNKMTIMFLNFGKSEPKRSYKQWNVNIVNHLLPPPPRNSLYQITHSRNLIASKNGKLTFRIYNFRDVYFDFRGGRNLSEPVIRH